MVVKEIEAKSLLRKHKKIDSWFVSRYGMNLYRGCQHNCAYCDGRAEGYYADGEFGKDIFVKKNAIEVLRRELDPKRKRVPLKRGFVMVGGGVGDSYQPIEKKYKLARGALELICKHNFPVHMLTKSTLIKRDLDILEKINKKSRAIVSFSFSSVDDKISAIFEPGASRPSEKMKTIKIFKERGIACGMFLLPVIPFITDSQEMMEETISNAKEEGIDFIIFGGMTLKEGRQKEHFLNILKRHYPEFVSRYDEIYNASSKWGEPDRDYYNEISLRFNEVAKRYKMARRVPVELFRGRIEENDLVVLLLEHIDYFLKMEGRSSPFGYAAYSISKSKESLSEMKNNLKNIKGVGKTTERVILEILNTKTSLFYEKSREGILPAT